MRQNFNPRSPYGERLRERYVIPHLHPNFNPRSPYGERHAHVLGAARAAHISIHAPHTGSDPRRSPRPHRLVYFNPRSPYGERPLTPTASSSRPNFNPRSPYGERPGVPAGLRDLSAFQSTLPIRGATISGLYSVPSGAQFQSTLPIRGATCGKEMVDYKVEFQSTLPIRGATRRQPLKQHT